MTGVQTCALPISNLTSNVEIQYIPAKLSLIVTLPDFIKDDNNTIRLGKKEKEKIIIKIFEMITYAGFENIVVNLEELLKGFKK